LAEILSEMMIGSVDMRKLFEKGTLQSIRTRLDQRSLILGHMKDDDILFIYRRRLLNKAIRMLTLCALTDRDRKFIQSINLAFLGQN
jgi:hypothetical protein